MNGRKSLQSRTNIRIAKINWKGCWNKKYSIAYKENIFKKQIMSSSSESDSVKFSFPLSDKTAWLVERKDLRRRKWIERNSRILFQISGYFIRNC